VDRRVRSRSNDRALRPARTVSFDNRCALQRADDSDTQPTIFDGRGSTITGQYAYDKATGNGAAGANTQAFTGRELDAVRPQAQRSHPHAPDGPAMVRRAADTVSPQAPRMKSAKCKSSGSSM
jgi:hypothetical protein